MAREIAKTYEPQQIEGRWAEVWVKEELFKADANAAGPVFSIVIPPPNVTGSLHIGHMLEHTEIDILTRWHRMRGYNTLYLPGMDHAGISTQRVVVKYLADQGIDYQKLGREEFERRVWQWKEEKGGEITTQMRQIGESCDWSREAFTLSPKLSRVVRKVFVQLYREGLIYRATRLVNWCTECQTVLSDLEVLHEERQGSLWYIRYPVEGGSESVVVATTRPETMLGDTAVAVNPEDERYRGLVGKTLILPLLGRRIPVIADAMVDKEFGTGAVKITPAHDPNDFEVGKRHNLPEIDVMTPDGRMSAAAGPYARMERFEARKRVVADLEAQGLLVKTAPHVSAIGLCERSKTVVEPRIMTQWFCNMKPLAEKALAAVERGEMTIVPDNRRVEFFHWLTNIRDWTLSRQLWWGHRIPAWYCGDCGEAMVAEETPAKCGKCGSAKLVQDPDVLDTWFSSGLWPFSTLGWPEETADFKKYYPTSLLITGYDILFFWVARMAMLGIHFTGQVPFRHVYLHMLVRTGSGEKMSKSKGTGLDPVTLNEQYGTDAMRFCLAAMAAPGTDIVLSEDRLASARNFANKIWNAARFLFVNLDKFEQTGAKLEELAAPEVRAKAPYALNGEVPLVDAWLFSRLASTIEAVNGALTEYRFHEAAQGVYQFFWGDFCDWYIEWVKPELLSANRERAVVAWKNLFAAFDAALRLLHPFMPFLTEELWHQLPQKVGAKSIALDRFPEPFSVASEPDDEPDEPALFGRVQEIVSQIRDIRAQEKLDPKKPLEVELWISEAALRDAVAIDRQQIERVAVLSRLHLAENRISTTGGFFRSTLNFDIKVVYGSQGDREAEKTRLAKMREERRKSYESKQRQLSNPTFRERAPANVVRDMETKLMEDYTELQKIDGRLAELSMQ